jgi:hypothetical protein
MRVAVVAVLAFAGIARAQQPTVSDIALCNQEADAATGVSALPRMPGTRETNPPTVTPPTTRGPERGTETDSTGSIVTRAPDPLLEGMAADKLDDRAYRAAYRQCMERQFGRPRR